MISTLTERQRSLGAVYTPSFLARYLSEKVLLYIPPLLDLKVIDPACGDGALLRAFSASASRLPERRNIYFLGIDKDPLAISNATTNLAADRVKGVKLIQRDALLGWKGAPLDDVFGLGERGSRTCRVALSNPPWGADFGQKARRQLENRFSLAKGQFDSYDVFVEMIVKGLGVGDLFGLILPDSLFGKEHERLRRLLLETTQLNFVARLGEKLFPRINRGCVVLIGSKGNPSNEHTVDCLRLDGKQRNDILSERLDLTDIDSGLIHKVPQNRFRRDANAIIDLDLKISEKAFARIQDCRSTLIEYVTITRGVELSKKGKVCRCKNCGLWMPFPNSNVPKCVHCGFPIDVSHVESDQIILDHNGPGNFTFKSGEDLHRYTSFSKSWIDTTKKGINYKNLGIYSKDKILVRKTGVGITASLDYEASITNQVVYILNRRPSLPPYVSLEFILAILNSRAMSYYLLKRYGENEWRSHPYVTQTILSKLPFPAVNSISSDLIESIRLVTRQVRREVTRSKEVNISPAIDAVIERLVAELFALKRQDYMEIYRCFEESQPLIPIRRLLDCKFDQIFS